MTTNDAPCLCPDKPGGEPTCRAVRKTGGAITCAWFALVDASIRSGVTYTLLFMFAVGAGCNLEEGRETHTDSDRVCYRVDVKGVPCIECKRHVVIGIVSYESHAITCDWSRDPERPR